jgi:hypothetical protein
MGHPRLSGLTASTVDGRHKAGHKRLASVPDCTIRMSLSTSRCDATLSACAFFENLDPSPYFGFTSEAPKGQRLANCACARLQLRCQREPTRVLVCHCVDCRRRTGSVFGIAAFSSAAR